MREAIRSEELPVEVTVAPDGQAAMDIFDRAETDPDALCPQALLLDLNLPKVEGFEILRRLRGNEKFKTIPVIVVSSSESPSDRSRAAEFGAGYFRKPTSYDQFLKIGKVLRQMLVEKGMI